MFDNRYEIIRRLGSGGMADVYLARDTHLERRVAIKVLYKRYADDEEFVARFRQEAKAAAGLNHPHIVSIYDRGGAEGSYYIAMEYLGGRNLKQIINERGRLEPRQAIDIAAQILEALRFAHKHDVIHRDIKPHNIVVNGDGQVKVTDFGIARAGSAARMTETGSIIGTAQYLSPEQARGQEVSQGSDLYSVGIVLYEMLTGQVPFEGENPVAIALKQINEAPVPPQVLAPDIPDNLNTVVMKALAKDPRSRYRDADEFLEDLERCRRDLPVAPPPAVDEEAPTQVIGAAEVAAARGRPRRKRRPLLYAGLVLAILAFAALAMTAYYYTFSGRGVPVPDVVGLDQEQAQQVLRAAGFEVEIEAREYSDTVPEGRVISQDPAAGEKLKEGGKVRLVVSRGSGKVQVPDLVGQTADYAEAKLAELELEPERQPDQYSDTVPAGSVMSQDPPAGTEVQKGSRVKYVVSKGPEPPAAVTVPDLGGLTVEEARDRLAASGLALGSVSEVYSSSIPAGEVISQNPAAGQSVDEGTAVSIVVSKGPEPPSTVTVPSVVGKTEAAAGAEISAAGLTPVTNPVPAPTPADVGKVISQNPAAGADVSPGSTVVIDVGT